jgi:hypothetical protein
MTHQNNYRISKVIFFSFLFIFLFLISSANAADRFWVASGSGDKIWWDNNNWSNQSGGTPGANPPSGSDKAYFDANSTLDVNVTTNVTVNKLIMRRGYTGTININIPSGQFNAKQGVVHSGGTIIVSDGELRSGKAYTLGAGGHGPTLTFTGNTSKFRLNHNFVMYNGSTFTAPGAGASRFILKGGFRLNGGTFYHNDGTLRMNPRYDGPGESALGAGITISGGPGPNKNFYNLTKGVNKNVTLYSDIEVENKLQVVGTGRLRAKDTI